MQRQQQHQQDSQQALTSHVRPPNVDHLQQQSELSHGQRRSLTALQQLAHRRADTSVLPLVDLQRPLSISVHFSDSAPAPFSDVGLARRRPSIEKGNHAVAEHDDLLPTTVARVDNMRAHSEQSCLTEGAVFDVESADPGIRNVSRVAVAVLVCVFAVLFVCYLLGV